MYMGGWTNSYYLDGLIEVIFEDKMYGELHRN